MPLYEIVVSRLNEAIARSKASRALWDSKEKTLRALRQRGDTARLKALKRLIYNEEARLIMESPPVVKVVKDLKRIGAKNPYEGLTHLAAVEMAFERFYGLPPASRELEQEEDREEEADILVEQGQAGFAAAFEDF